MAEEFTSPFDDSPLNHFESQTALGQFDGSYVEDGWVHHVDQAKLISFLINAKNEDKQRKFYWGSFKGPMSSVTTPVNALDGTEETTATYPGDKKISVRGYKLNSMYASMRARNGEYINPYPGHSIKIDLDKGYASYNVYFNYREGTTLLPEGSTATYVDDLFNERTKYIVAVRFRTSNYFSFDLFYQAFGIDIGDKINAAFGKAYRSIPNGDWAKKKTFYKLAPRKYLTTLTETELFKDFKGLLEYDSGSWFLDASHAMVKCLGAIANRKGGMAFLYKKFNDSPSYIKTVYNHLQSSSITPETGKEYQENKTVFASLLLAICTHNGQGFISERFKPHIVFHLDKRWYKVDSGSRKDDKQGEYSLTQMKYKKGLKFGPSTDGSLEHKNVYADKDWFVHDVTQDLHPLDIVTLYVPGKQKTSGEQGEMLRAIGAEEEAPPISIRVPAIFIYNNSYHREWAEFEKVIRLGIDLLIIAISAFTLVAGPGALMTLLSIMDLGLAAADFSIQTFEDEIRAIPGGDEFLDKWEKIYFLGGMVTAIAALPSLLGGGAKLLLKATGKTLVQLKLMLENGLKYMDNFPQFVKGSFEIFTDYAPWFKKTFIDKMIILHSHGVMFIKGTVVGDKVSSLFLNYKGIMIAKGTHQEIKDLVKRIGEKGKGTVKYLDDIYSRLKPLNAEGAAIVRGKYLGQVLKKSDIDTVSEFLVKYKVEFQLGPESGPFIVHGYYLPDGSPIILGKKTAAYFITDGRRWKLVLRENATVYELLHELMHFRHCKSLGKRRYLKLGSSDLGRTILRERHVYDKMVQYQKYLSRGEMKHAEDYMNFFYPNTEVGIDLSKIGTKKKPVSIDTILNLK